MPFNDDPRRNSVHAARALRDGEEICVVGLRETSMLILAWSPHMTPGASMCSAVHI